MKNNLNKYFGTENVHYMALGYTCGYPKCCIEAFIEDRMIPFRNNGPESMRKPLLEDNRSGFIPCEKHEKQIKSGKITLSSLI